MIVLAWWAGRLLRTWSNRYGTPARRLVTDPVSGAVTGVVAGREEETRADARGGVVLATGGRPAPRRERVRA